MLVSLLNILQQFSSLQTQQLQKKKKTPEPGTSLSWILTFHSLSCMTPTFWGSVVKASLSDIYRNRSQNTEWLI